MRKRALIDKAGEGAQAPLPGLDDKAVVAKGDAPVEGERSELDVAIATELAPAVAIALLATTEKTPDSPSPALECLAAGVSPSEDDGKVRVQLVFENGAVLPVEMSRAAGDALTHGLVNELGTQAGPSK